MICHNLAKKNCLLASGDWFVHTRKVNINPICILLGFKESSVSVQKLAHLGHTIVIFAQSLGTTCSVKRRDIHKLFSRLLDS